MRRALDGAITRGRRTTPLLDDLDTMTRGPAVLESASGVVAIVARMERDTSALLTLAESLDCPAVVRSGALISATRVWGRVPVRAGHTRDTALESEALRDYARHLGALYRAVAPRAWIAQSGRVTEPLAPGAPWSTGSINRATATAYHRDTRNLPRTWSGMLVLRGDGVTGGALVLPEYRVALDLQEGDVLLLDGHGTWHGNLPLAVPPSSWRYSLPCYAMRGS